ncbi:MAG: DUF1549 domain-containing protein [Acidimicrobiia bacterium]|nr:DUF1549 domain-containing protein [Acidimicrobiia bacterium]
MLKLVLQRMMFLTSCLLILFVLIAQTRAQVHSDQISAAALPPPARLTVDFNRDIAPILEERCLGCHGSVQQLSGLRLDNPADALKGGYSGPAIVPGNSRESKLIHMVAGLKKGMVLPLGGERLSPRQVGILRAWIDQGARWSEVTIDKRQIEENQRQRTNRKHWALSPPRRPTLPKVKNALWARNPIDAFVLARLESAGISPSPEADRANLVRRLSLDLTGLPPTLEEVSEFLADKRPDAYERLVDHLLASPHYGEKWARHWMDLAHYADSDGYWDDHLRPHAWRWRHWVVDAMNRNMPFDQFTIEQLAGDLLPDGRLDQKVATGFLRNTLTNTEGGVKKEEFRVEQIVDRTSTVGQVWLGLTVGCARCHDHKFDPISQKEFYQLFAFFDTTTEVNIEAPLQEEMGPFLRRKPEYDRKRKALLAEYGVKELQSEWEKKTLDAATNSQASFEWRLSWEILGLHTLHGQDYLRFDPNRRTQKQEDLLTDHFVKWYNLVVTKQRIDELKFEELDGKLEKLAEQFPLLTEAQVIAENPVPPKTHILIRGDYLQPGTEVQPGAPAVLNPLENSPKATRLTLARWLVSPANPLTARVTVNRMWQEFFGYGLVESSGDFGTRADRPSHPKLLDWLATEFVRNQWNVKKMHKLIVQSATYRQSSKARKDLQGRDPYNRLLARQNRLRLSAEAVRDTTLAVSGLLNLSIGGKSVRPPVPPGGYTKTGIRWKEDEGPDRYRRGLYIFFQRTSPYPQLMSFDAPDSLQVCTRRERSSTPIQALNLLNDPVFFEAAQALAVRILREKPTKWSDQLDYAFRLCLGRTPRSAEFQRLADYFGREKERLLRDPVVAEQRFPAKGMENVNVTEAAAWTTLSSVLLNLDEFVTRR